MKDLSELRIYRMSVEIGEMVWAIVTGLPSFEKWTLGKQVAESADGIAANMIEGYYRYAKGDQHRFFQYALASAKETQLWLWRLKERGLLDTEKHTALSGRLNDLVPQMLAFMRTLRERSGTSDSR